MLRPGWVPPAPAHHVAAIVGDALLRVDGRLVAILAMDAPDGARARQPAFLTYVGYTLAVLDEDVTCAIEVSDEALDIAPWCTFHGAATAGEAHSRLRRLAACLRGFLLMQAYEGLARQRRCLIALAVPGGPSQIHEQRPIEIPAPVAARLDAQVERLTCQVQPIGIDLTRLDAAALALLVNRRLQPGRTARAASRVGHLSWRHRPAIVTDD